MKETDERTTPLEFFNKLNSVFHFELDAAATHANTLCEKYYTIETDGLASPWAKSTFCNPPYSRGEIIKWIKKAYNEKIERGCFSVLLLPGDMSTKWFTLARGLADILYSIEGRLKFNGNKDLAKFGTIIAIFGQISLQTLMELKKQIPGFAFNNSLEEQIWRALQCEIIFPYKDLE